MKKQEKEGGGKKREKSEKKGVPKKGQIFMKTEVAKRLSFLRGSKKGDPLFNHQKKVRWAF